MCGMSGACLIRLVNLDTPKYPRVCWLDEELFEASSSMLNVAQVGPTHTSDERFFNILDLSFPI